MFDDIFDGIVMGVYGAAGAIGVYVIAAIVQIIGR